ncbi:MAG TPA: CBS domain-containing protein [Vicinamibacterales bacterium]|nr:CBS domain-containing protein [Vicinamibacterales bacterium]
MQVKDVMTHSPGTCGVRDSANDAARIMWERDCGAVPVIDQSGCVVGIVTDRDICMAAYFHGTPLSSIPLTAIMSREVCTCEEQQDVTEAERLMRVRRVRRLPVTANGGSLAGIVSLSDLAQTVSDVGGLERARGDSRELLETLTVVSEPRHRSRVS